MEFESSPALENTPEKSSQQAGAEVRSLLKEWIPGASAAFGRTHIYSKLLSDARTVSLPNYDRVAYYAMLFDKKDGINDWRQSARLPVLLSAWLNDSASLKRPEPIALMIGMVEFSNLLMRGAPLNSTTAAMEAAGVRPSHAGALARFDTVPYEEIISARTFIQKALGSDPLGDTFEERWNEVPRFNVARVGDLSMRLRNMAYLSSDLAEIFAVPGEKIATVTRTLAGTLLSPSVPLGHLEILGGTDLESTVEGITRQLDGSREARQRKGRYSPHDSVVIRDVFGIPEELPETSRRLEMTTNQMQAMEALPDENSDILAASIGCAVEQTAGFLRRAIANRLAHSPFLESNDFFESMRRLDRCGFLASGVLGRSRYSDLLEGKYLPPFSAIDALFGDSKVPDFISVKARILFGDRHVAAMNAPQRFVTALCEEVAASRNEFRRLDAEKKGEDWSKAAFERFFSTLGDSRATFQPHLKRVVDSFSKSEKRHQRLDLLMREFRDRITFRESLSYSEVVLASAKKSDGFSRWLDSRLQDIGPAILVMQNAEKAPEPGTQDTMKLLSALDRLQSVVSKSTSAGHQRVDRSSSAHAWRSAAQLFEWLPGITLPELCEVLVARDISIKIQERPRDKTAMTFEEIVRHAVTQHRAAPSAIERKQVAVPNLSLSDASFPCSHNVNLDDFAEDETRDRSGHEDDNGIVQVDVAGDESLRSGDIREDSPIQEEASGTVMVDEEISEEHSGSESGESELDGNAEGEEDFVNLREGEEAGKEPVGEPSESEESELSEESVQSNFEEETRPIRYDAERPHPSDVDFIDPIRASEVLEEGEGAKAVELSPVPSNPPTLAPTSVSTETTPAPERRAWHDIPKSERIALMAQRHEYILTRGGGRKGATMSVFDNIDLSKPLDVPPADSESDSASSGT